MEGNPQNHSDTVISLTAGDPSTTLCGFVSVFPHQEAQDEGGGSVHTPQSGPLSHLSAAIHQICECQQNRPVLGNFCDSSTKFHY